MVVAPLGLIYISCVDLPTDLIKQKLIHRGVLEQNTATISQRSSGKEGFQIRGFDFMASSSTSRRQLWREASLRLRKEVNVRFRVYRV